jgi:hypothetical protein
MGFFSKDIDWSFAPIRNIEKKMPWAQKARGKMESMLHSDVRYPMQEIAGLSPYETQGMQQLSDIIGGKSFQDPRTSPLYQGLRGEMESLTGKGVSALRHRQNLGGMFRSSPGERAEGEFRGDMANRTLQILGQLYESERARDNPYTRLQAAMTYGGLPRQIEQAGMDASYTQQLQNLMAPYQLQLPIALQLLGYQPFQSATGMIQPTAASQVGALMGGGGQAAGGAARLAKVLSDRRLKQNIRYVDGLWATWTWAPAAKRYGLAGAGSGLIAQDVLEFAPRAVSRHESGYWMIDYSLL